MRRGRAWVVVIAFVGVLGVTALAAELTEEASLAYREHVEAAHRAFLERLEAPPGRDAADREALRAARTLAHPGQSDGIMKVPKGLVHHWRGAIFVSGATLDRALDVSRAYREYPAIYRPVLEADVLAETGDEVRVRLRMKESAGGLTATLDVWSTVRYTRIDATHAYSVANADEIREVKDAGRSNERLLPAGRDSGYLWHAGTLTRFVEADGGVYVEMETIGLSRPFPPLLGWIIEPIARHIGRRSVEASVQEFARAIARSRDAS